MFMVWAILKRCSMQNGAVRRGIRTYKAHRLPVMFEIGGVRPISVRKQCDIGEN